MLPGYNTNGFAHHRISDCLRILRDIGYESVALTLDVDLLDPPDQRGVSSAVRLLRPLVRDLGFRVTIETGARFILDPFRKHQPTLLSDRREARQMRLDYLMAAMDVAAELAADSVSIWSGTAEPGADAGESFDRLVSGVGTLLDKADAVNVRLAFEPEPGMLIDTMAVCQRLHEAVRHDRFGLTLDIGHVHCLGDGDIVEHIRRWRDVLWNVHIEDMRRGVHEHLMFGDGDVDFVPVFGALRHVAYAGPLHVELSRHSHDAVESARKAFDFLCKH